MKFSSTLEESGGRARRTVGVTEGGSPRSEKKFGGFLDVGGWARRLGEEFGGEDAAGRRRHSPVLPNRASKEATGPCSIEDLHI